MPYFPPFASNDEENPPLTPLLPPSRPSPGPNKDCYYHKYFVRDYPELAKCISRGPRDGSSAAEALALTAPVPPTAAIPGNPSYFDDALASSGAAAGRSGRPPSEEAPSVAPSLLGRGPGGYGTAWSVQQQLGLFHDAAAIRQRQQEYPRPLPLSVSELLMSVSSSRVEPTIIIINNRKNERTHGT